jgi:glycine/D-amino acid oxidase-like deaminating enzyme
LPPLTRDVEADLAIVGGGFTGLWAALLALEDDPGRSVVVLEGDRIGEGASGRNGGFADPSLTHGISHGFERFADEMDALEQLGRRNFEDLLDSLERHEIDSNYEAVGKLNVAPSESWTPHLREHLEDLERVGESARWLDRDALRAELDSPTYFAGIEHGSGGGVLDPAKLCWGLRDAVLRLGARIFENTSVESIEDTPPALTLRSARGRVCADRAIFATNAYRSPLRPMRRAVIPVWDYVLMTEPLSASQMASIGWQHRQGVGDVTNQFHYYRLTRDDRILWGGYDAIYHYGSGLRPEHEQRPETFQMLAGHFFETFPQLDGLGFTHAWGGAIATTTRFCLDTGQAFGGRAAWSTGYTGLGVIASRFGARLALDRVDGRQGRHLNLRFSRTRPFPWPPEPLRSLVVQLTRHELARSDRNGGERGLWLRLLDRLGLGFDS